MVGMLQCAVLAGAQDVLFEQEQEDDLWSAAAFIYDKNFLKVTPRTCERLVLTDKTNQIFMLTCWL